MFDAAMDVNLCGTDPESIRKAGTVIRNGGLVAFPTETVYGLGADALNPIAVARIFEAKNRPTFDPLIVHLCSMADVTRLCTGIDRRATKLIKAFWPGPLTLVLPKSSAVPGIVTAGLPTVAVRMPSHPVALALIRESGTPIAAPSANMFGRLSPTSASHVAEQLGNRIDLIVDGGRCPLGIESTIVDLSGDRASIGRLGSLPVEDIEKVIGRVRITKPSATRPRAPGQLPRHYSPETPIRLVVSTRLEREFRGKKGVGYLSFKRPQKELPYKAVEVLSPTGDLREAAANLFACLHRLDEAGMDIILAEPVPEVGLGRAIMDRLRKASGKGALQHRC